MAETRTHWKKMTNTKYLGAWDLGDKDMIVRIKNICEEMVKDNKGQEEKVLIAYLDGNVKPQNEDGTFKHSEYGEGLPGKIEQPGYTELWKETVAREAGDVLKVKE